MAVAQPVHNLTEAEYLEIERAAEFRSEYLNGSMVPIKTGPIGHSLILSNLTGELSNLMDDRGGLVFGCDLRLKVEATGLYTYPDISVVCGKPRDVDDRKDTIVNPTVLVEVLSDSTEAYDRGRKFEHYRQIPSLKEYLLVSQTEPRIEQFIWQENNDWLLQSVSGLEATLSLPSLQVTLALAEVYLNVEFQPAPLRAPAPPRS